MEVVSIGISIIFLLAFVALWWTKRKSQEENEEVDSCIYVPPIGPPPGNVPNSPNSLISDHWFTLAELKQAEDGKYSWDETGCVFEINTDGSVTIVGHFDPAELQVDPVQEMFERLNADGLIDMLPQMWSYHAVNNQDGERDVFVFANNDDILSIPVCPHSIDEVITTELIPSSYDGGKSVITFILSKTGEGVVMLLPSNETEYILSLGAKACINRAFGDKVSVKITSPSVMGAFGIAITRPRNKATKISFAFAPNDNYMCCNLSAGNGIFEVTKLLSSSILQPIEPDIALGHIAKGCMVQSLVFERLIDNCILIDMLPYSLSLLLKESGHIVKIYDFTNEPITIPAKLSEKDIDVDSSKQLSFLIGSNELIEDVMSECDVHIGDIAADVEVDGNMDIALLINTNSHVYKINIGELIG